MVRSRSPAKNRKQLTAEIVSTQYPLLDGMEVEDRSPRSGGGGRGGSGSEDSEGAGTFDPIGVVEAACEAAAALSRICFLKKATSNLSGAEILVKHLRLDKVWRTSPPSSECELSPFTPTATCSVHRPRADGCDLTGSHPGQMDAADEARGQDPDETGRLFRDRRRAAVGLRHDAAE